MNQELMRKELASIKKRIGHLNATAQELQNHLGKICEEKKALCSEYLRIDKELAKVDGRTTICKPTKKVKRGSYRTKTIAASDAEVKAYLDNLSPEKAKQLVATMKG